MNYRVLQTIRSPKHQDRTRIKPGAIVSGDDFPLSDLEMLVSRKILEAVPDDQTPDINPAPPASNAGNESTEQESNTSQEVDQDSAPGEDKPEEKPATGKRKATSTK